MGNNIFGNDSSLTVYCANSSALHTYCQNNNVAFELID